MNVKLTRRSLFGLSAVALSVFCLPAHAGSYDDFFKAINIDDVGTLERLSDLGFDMNTLDAKGQCALYLAMREGSFKVAKYLIDHPKVDLDLANKVGETPIMMALLKGRLEWAKRMYERDEDIINKPGWTPLHYAATYAGEGAKEQVAWLLENHAYIDAESPNKTTPLMMAAQYGSEDVVALLLAEGADAELRNQRRMSAIDFAQRSGRRPVAELIGQYIRKKRSTGKW